MRVLADHGARGATGCLPPPACTRGRVRIATVREGNGFEQAANRNERGGIACFAGLVWVA